MQLMKDMALQLNLKEHVVIGKDMVIQVCHEATV
jgi:hypothetical protein